MPPQLESGSENSRAGSKGTALVALVVVCWWLSPIPDSIETYLILTEISWGLHTPRGGRRAILSQRSEHHKHSEMT